MAPHCIGSAWAHGKAPLPAAAAEWPTNFGIDLLTGNGRFQSGSHPRPPGFSGPGQFGGPRDGPRPNNLRSLMK